MSGLYRGSQLNWAALTKKAYSIYISVKKLPFYLNDADIMLRSDHLSLQRLLEKYTLNSKVNNLVVEIERYQIKFKYIRGIKNTLADAVGRLVELDPGVCKDPECEGQENGDCMFEQLPDVSNVQ